MMPEKLQVVTDQEWQEIDTWNQDIVQEFLEQQHLSPKTLNVYRSGLRQFFKWVKDNCRNKPLHELKPRDALRYQNYLLERNLSSSAVKFKRSSVSSLCNFVELYYSDEFPKFRNIYNKSIPNPAKTARHEKEPLTPQEYKLLCNTLEERNEWQMLAYVKFIYDSSCRRAEARQILKEISTYSYAKDKDGKERPLYLTHNIRAKGRGKEGKVKKLSFNDDTMKAIRKWVQVRGQDDCEYLFVNKHVKVVKQLSETAFNFWCSSIFSEIIGRRVHPHMFRSTRATHLKNEGKDIKQIQALLGHKSSTTTEIYIIRDESEDVDGIYE